MSAEPTGAARQEAQAAAGPSGDEVRPVDQAKCDAALGRINEFFAGDLTQEDAEEILAALRSCEPCASQLDLEAAVREMVRRCCKNDRAPETLRLKIISSITQVRVERT